MDTVIGISFLFRSWKLMCINVSNSSENRGSSEDGTRDLHAFNHSMRTLCSILVEGSGCQ